MVDLLAPPRQSGRGAVVGRHCNMGRSKHFRDERPNRVETTVGGGRAGYRVRLTGVEGNKLRQNV